MKTMNKLVLSATSMIGDKVKNSAGDQLGGITEIMIDVHTGQVVYAVLSFGGFLGLGDKLFAIPWESLTIDTSDHTFILDVPKEVLQNAEGFDQDNWPNFADPEWSRRTYAHYGVEPYWN